MAAGSWNLYTKALQNTFSGSINWTAATIRCVLVTSAYTVNADTDALWSAVSGSQATGAGYTAGGVVLNTPVVTVNTNTVTASGGSMSWTASTITAKYAVFVLSTGGATPNSGDLLLCYCLLDSGGANVSTTNGTLSISGYSIAITHTP